MSQAMKMLLLFAASIQLVHMTVSVECEWNLEATSLDDAQRRREFFKEFCKFSHEQHCTIKELQWKSESTAECERRVETLKLNHSTAEKAHAAELQSEIASMSAQLRQYELEIKQLKDKNDALQKDSENRLLQQEMHLEDIQISLTDNNTTFHLCDDIRNSKCVGVRCYDVILAQKTKALSYLKASVMYNNIITQLSSCLQPRNDHLESIKNEKAEIDRILEGLGKYVTDAARRGDFDLVRNLISSGADVNATDADGSSALILAIKSNSTSIAKLLAKSGANIEARDGQNFTAVVRAADVNNFEICKLLLDSGADIHVQNKDGLNALMYAVYRRNLALVTLLLERGAQVNVANRNGYTPLHMAARDGDVDIAKLLLQHGSNLNDKNKQDRTPLGYALLYSKSEMIIYLKSIGATS